MKIRLFLFGMWLVLSTGIAAADTEWTSAAVDIADKDFRCVAIDPKTPAVIYTGAYNALYMSADGGGAWKQIFICKGAYKGVNRVYIGRDGSLTIATNNGLYVSRDAGQSWTRSFRGKEAENNVLCVAYHPVDKNTFFIGTERGLFVTRDAGKAWRRSWKAIGSAPVKSIAVKPSNPNVIYVCTDNILYKTRDGGKNWEKTVELPGSRNGEDAEEPEEEESTAEESEACGTVFNHVTMTDDAVYLATNKGVFLLEGSRPWEKIDDTGLTDKNVNFILLSNKDSAIYAATNKGIFKFSDKEGKWSQFYSGSAPFDVNHMAFGSAAEGLLWLATSKGLYRTYLRDAGGGPAGPEGDIFSRFLREPSIREVQDAAIRYAEVHPDKIKKWRRGAKLKAILPKVTFGIDKSTSDTYEIYTSSTQTYSVVGPKDFTEGWDISFSWDLSDLIWNDAQTNIDVRSKLMVQLRDDILDEVTRYYYERRRLQADLAMKPPAEESGRVEKELRLEELTAYIDGLTGGYFSRQLQSEKGDKQ